MPILRGVRSEILKLRHTAVLWMHLLLPVFGSAVFLLYFTLYPQEENIRKIFLILELTAIVFPVIISLVCGIWRRWRRRRLPFKRC